MSDRSLSADEEQQDVVGTGGEHQGSGLAPQASIDSHDEAVVSVDEVDTEQKAHEQQKETETELSASEVEDETSQVGEDAAVVTEEEPAIVVEEETVISDASYPTEELAEAQVEDPTEEEESQLPAEEVLAGADEGLLIAAVVVEGEKEIQQEPLVEDVVDAAFLADSETLAGQEEDEEQTYQASLRRISPFFVVLLCIATFTIWMGLIPLTQTILPTQVALIYEGQTKEAVSAAAVLQAIGGFCALVVYPLVGALSDRTRSRFGRRKPWIVVGVVLAAVMLFLLANAPSYGVLVIAWIGFCLGATTTQSSLFTLIPDKIPVHLRARVAAFMGLMAPVGIVAGNILAGVLSKSGHFTVTYYVIAVVELVGVFTFVSFLKETLPDHKIPRFQLGHFLKGFWVNPRTNRDFAIAWLARLCIIFGCVTIQDYLIFFLHDAGLFSVKDASFGVAQFQSLSTIGILVGSFGTGFLSDRLRRRKPFSIMAGIFVALALVAVGISPTLGAVFAAALLFGLGFGAYSATEVALDSQLVRSKESHGTDMGVLAVAGNLPQVVGPFLAARVFAATGSFSLLFLGAAVLPLISAVCIPFIRRVK